MIFSKQSGGWRFLALTAALLSVASGADRINLGGREVVLWKPEGTAPPGGFPVVIFSHGFGGCNTQSVFLMEALAREGYLVAAPNHADARCGTARRLQAGKASPEESFEKAQNWSDTTYKDRRADIAAVLDAVAADVHAGKTFQGVPVNLDKIGIAGHSLGGYTALGMAGAWPSWKDARIKAVLALSPYNTPFIAKGDLGHLNVPVMYQGGTLDFGISPTVRRLNGAYDRSSSPKYYVEFQKAGHLAWTGLNPAFHAIIDRYSVAFFNRYLKGDASSDPLAGLFEKKLAPGISVARSDVK